MSKKVMTIGLVCKGNKILLGMKKRGFGEGRWNGFGGKVHEGESIEEGLAREVQEEAGLTVLDFAKKGVINFHFEDKDDQPEVHIFEITKYQGKPIETEEMRPKWFEIDSIPYGQMWPADCQWFPYFLEKKEFQGEVFFKDNNEVRSFEINKVSK